MYITDVGRNTSDHGNMKGTIMDLEKKDRERVNLAFEKGTESFTRDDLQKVMNDSATAEKKASYLGEQFENFVLLWGLLKDYWNGEYKNAPWRLIAAIGFAVAYLVSPIDVIPDFIPVLGFVDDAAVFALTIAAFQAEIDDYKKWKAAKEAK